MNSEKIKEEFGYKGKPKQWQNGFDALLKHMPDYLKAKTEPVAEVPCSDRVMPDAFNLCKPPFFYRVGYIFDAADHMIADNAGEGAFVRLRGWGRLGDMDKAEELQDAIGKHIAQAMTEYWEKRA